MTGARLLADIGGTNARFACATADGDVIGHRYLSVADYADFGAALGAYLDETGGAGRFGAAAIAAAGPVHQGAIQLTNASWHIDAARVSDRLDGAPTRLMNDLEAVAMALPYLTEHDLLWLGEKRCILSEQARMTAINVGTGFGAATIISHDGNWITCPSEAGHMSLGAQNAAELEVLCGADKRALSIETVLSGNGMPRLYAMLSRHYASSSPLPETPDDVMARVDSDDPVAGEVLRCVTTFLGRVAGDLALATASWGGVYFCGSVAHEWARVTDIRVFRHHFEDKGKMSSKLRETPTALIVNQQPAFIGLAHARIPET